MFIINFTPIHCVKLLKTSGINRLDTMLPMLVVKSSSILTNKIARFPNWANLSPWHGYSLRDTNDAPKDTRTYRQTDRHTEQATRDTYSPTYSKNINIPNLVSWILSGHFSMFLLQNIARLFKHLCCHCGSYVCHFAFGSITFMEKFRRQYFSLNASRCNTLANPKISFILTVWFGEDRNLRQCTFN